MCRIVGGVCPIGLLRRPGGMHVRASDRRPRGATHEGHMQSYGSQTDVGVAAGLKFLLLDDATRLVLIYKAIFGESLDDIIFSFLLLFLLLTCSFPTDHLLDVRGGFLR